MRQSEHKISRKTKLTDLPEFLTPKELQDFLGIGRTTAYQLIRSKTLPSLRLGKRIFIPKGAFENDG